jgi:hypothetical protein
MNEVVDPYATIGKSCFMKILVYTCLIGDDTFVKISFLFLKLYQIICSLTDTVSPTLSFVCKKFLVIFNLTCIFQVCEPSCERFKDLLKERLNLPCQKV